MFTICFVLWIGVSNLFAEDTPGELSGKFRISATTNEYIHFSMGNLRKAKKFGTWLFFTNQYDTIGADNSKISSSTSAVIDQFGFSGNNKLAPPYDYGDNFVTDDETYSGDFLDWGDKKISNGGNTAHIWSTLSKTEWNYILTQRPNANKLQKIVTVGGIQGLLLLPDESTATIADSYTTTDFTTAQNNDGAVFLPFAGRREGTTVENVNVEGYYWTSSMNGNLNAYMLHLSTGAVLENSPRHFGYTVRLVKRYNECKYTVKAEAVDPTMGSCSIEIIE